MFTLLADAMFTATLARRGSKIPDRLKNHADRYVPDDQRKRHEDEAFQLPYRQLW